jgi:type II secretory pathway component PulK
MSRRDPRRGIVLLAVIGLTAVASLAVGVAAIAAQTQAISARAAVTQAQMRATFDAAIATTMFQILATGNPAFSPDGRLSRWAMGATKIDLRVVAEAGRLDLNNAPAGDAQRMAKHFAATRGTYRDPVEARGWPGMTPALFARLLPYLTVHGDAATHAELSPGALLTARAPTNLAAIQTARAEGLPSPPHRISRFALFLDVAEPDGARRAELVIVAAPGASGPYEILSRRRLKTGAIADLFEGAQ